MVNQMYRFLADEAEKDENLLDVLNELESITGKDFEDFIDEIDEMIEKGMTVENISTELLKL